MSIEIIVALIGACASIVAALLGREKEKKRPNQTETAQRSAPSSRPTLVFISTLATGLAITAFAIALLWSRGPSGPQGLQGPQGPPGSSGSPVPVGGIICFWGASANTPKGFEVCDGELVTTATSPILGKRKPDLRGRFVRGASGSVPDIAALKREGTETFSLTVGNLPKHLHDVKVALAESTTHSHELSLPITKEDIEQSSNYGRTYVGGDMENPIVRSRARAKSTEAGAHVHDATVTETAVGDSAQILHLPPYQEILFLIRVE